MAARTNSSWAPRGPRSRSRPSFRMRLRCANRISIFLRSRRDSSKASVSASERATSRACSWMSRGILRDGFLRAALRFERAYIAVELAGAIQERLALVHCAARSKPLPAGALVNVVCRVISEVPTREGAIVPLRLVEHRNMGRDTFLLNQPVQHWSRPVGGISDKPLRLKGRSAPLFVRSRSLPRRPRPAEWSERPRRQR
jgi:hypothetical protein